MNKYIQNLKNKDIHENCQTCKILSKLVEHVQNSSNGPKWSEMGLANQVILVNAVLNLVGEGG